MNQSTYNKLSASSAFIIWFTWTYHVNQNADNVFYSSLTQGLISATITLFMVKVINVLGNKFKNTLSKIFLPSIIVSSSCFLLGYVIHSSIRTSQIFETLIPAILVGFVFCIFTSVKNIISQENKNV